MGMTLPIFSIFLLSIDLPYSLTAKPSMEKGIMAAAEGPKLPICLARSGPMAGISEIQARLSRSAFEPVRILR